MSFIPACPSSMFVPIPTDKVRKNFYRGTVSPGSHESCYHSASAVPGRLLTHNIRHVFLCAYV